MTSAMKAGKDAHENYASDISSFTLSKKKNALSMDEDSKGEGVYVYAASTFLLAFAAAKCSEELFSMSENDDIVVRRANLDICVLHLFNTRNGTLGSGGHSEADENTLQGTVMKAIEGAHPVVVKTVIVKSERKLSALLTNPISIKNYILTLAKKAEAGNQVALEYMRLIT